MGVYSLTLICIVKAKTSLGVKLAQGRKSILYFCEKQHILS